MQRTILLAAVFSFLPPFLPAQPTSWEALANRILGIPKGAGHSSGTGLTEQRLRHLAQSYTVEEVEPNLLKVTHKETGLVRYVDITDHWFDFDNSPPDIQVIDLINADTSLYNWKYIRQQNILLVGGRIGYPMVIGDFNNNGKIDFAGVYKIPINTDIGQAGIVELQSDSTFVVNKVYQDTVIIPYALTDVNNNGLLELNISNPLFEVAGQGFTNYEQSHPDSYPNVRQFTHRTWEFAGQVGSETFTDLDNDMYIDVLYKGTDSTVQCCPQVFVAEYDPSVNNFVRRFGVIPFPDWRVSGFSVGDFDGDGFTEFATGSGASFSHVYIWENTGDDSYSQVYVDTMTTANAYMTAATNDIDGNGRGEFFIGGSAFYSGIPASRIYWFEATGNNTYEKVRSFFLWGTDVLGFTELFIYDVNSDGIDDLVFSFSFSIVILTWNNAAQQFDLFYYDWWENLNQEIHSINMYDVFNRGYPDLFVSIDDIGIAPRVKSFYYKFNSITGIEIPSNLPEDFHLAQNYPNPFNSGTNIPFYLPGQESISLEVYDITGKEVIRLIDNRGYTPGEHTIQWNATNNHGKEVSSGIYLYVLKAGARREVRKMLLIR
ncbi:MAG: T9SS type A sorting domain-containing protein [Calditrichaceae bacterium]|nr:FG-GAP-like repeat-containing protein [Calditrichia bacterium]NUQ43545.1 T9SS type A sorting domain-containing protein [Calditrichaceae bacterium]